MIVVSQQENLIFDVTSSYLNRKTVIQLTSNITIVRKDGSETPNRMDSQLSASRTSRDLLSAFLTSDVLRVYVQDYIITNQDTVDHQVNITMKTGVQVSFKIINDVTIKAGESLYYSGNSYAVYNSNLEIQAAIFLDLEDVPNQYDTAFELLRAKSGKDGLEFADWSIDSNNNLLPKVYTQSIGDETIAPRLIAFNNLSGLKGFLGALESANGDILALIGVNTEGISEAEANTGILIWGEPILLESEVGYFLHVPSSVSNVDIENHYLVFGTVFTGPNSKRYVSLEVGPAVEYLLEETNTSSSDFDVTDTPTTVVSLTLANGYTAPTSFHFEVQISETGNRRVNFIIEVQKNGGTFYTHSTIPLQNNSTLVAFSAPIPSGSLPLDISDAISVRVEGVSTNPNSIAKVLGTVRVSEIGVRQEATVLAQVVSKTSDFSALATNKTILVDASSAPVTITLPSVAFFEADPINIKKIDASGNNVTIDGDGPTIDGAATKVITTQYDVVSLVSDGTNWWLT